MVDRDVEPFRELGGDRLTVLHLESDPHHDHLAVANIRDGHLAAQMLAGSFETMQLDIESRLYKFFFVFESFGEIGRAHV